MRIRYHLRNHSSHSKHKFILSPHSVSSDLISRVPGVANLGRALSERAECVLSGWIPVNSRLGAVRLNGYVRISSSRMKRPCLFILPVYAPTDCWFPEAKDDFYLVLLRLRRDVRLMDTVVIARDLNAGSGRHTGGQFFYPPRSHRQQRSHPSLF